MLIRRYLFLALSLIFLGGCQPAPVELTEIPSVDFSKLRSVVREQLQGAYAEVEASPKSATAAGELGMALHAYGQYFAAEAAYRRARQLEPTEPRWIYLHGITLQELHRNDEAEKAYGAIFWPRASARVIRMTIARGDTASALELVTQAIEHFPLDKELVYLQGQLLMESGNAQEAAGIFSRLLDDGVPLQEVLYSAAQAYDTIGNSEQAEAYLAQYQDAGIDHRRENWPDPLLAEVQQLGLSATAQVARARRLAEQGVPLPAVIKILEQAVAIDSEAHEAHIALVAMQAKVGNFAASDQHFRKAFELAPDIAQLHFNRGMAKYSEQQFQAATSALYNAIQLDPEHVLAHAGLGQILFEHGKIDVGMELVEKAVALAPARTSTQALHARMLIKQNRFADALATLTSVPRQPQPRIEHLLLQASAHLGLHDTVAARAALNKSLVLAEQTRSTKLLQAIQNELAKLPDA